MSDWNGELDTFFEGREQQGQQHQNAEAQPEEGLSEVTKFIASVAAPAFEAFAAALQKHGRRVRLRRGDTSMRIVVEYMGAEEFDFTLWAGINTLSTESRAGGRRVLGGFHNVQGTNAMADTTQVDVAQHLTERYIALNSRLTV